MSKNIIKGERIEDLKELIWLADNKRSVVVVHRGRELYVRPAAFLIGWTLRTLLKFEFHYAIKINS